MLDGVPGKSKNKFSFAYNFFIAESLHVGWDTREKKTIVVFENTHFWNQQISLWYVEIVLKHNTRKSKRMFTINIKNQEFDGYRAYVLHSK